MRSYRRLTIALAATLTGYAVVGATLGVTGRYEIYPVFSWFLFQSVPGPQERFGLEIVAANGEPVDPAPLFEAAGDLVPAPESITAQVVIRKLGAAFEKGRRREMERRRRVLESTYLAPGLSYRLVRVRYDPLELWRTGRREIRPVAEAPVWTARDRTAKDWTARDRTAKDRTARDRTTDE